MTTESLKLLRQRRSVRQYTDRPIEPEKVALLEEALLRSPSSRSLNPWEFIFVDDRKLLEELARAKPHGSAFLKGAALGIVVCGDESRCDVWIEDCSIASIIAQFTAQSLGLSSCWIQIRRRENSESTTAEEYVRNLLGIPAEKNVLSIVAIGYGAENKPPHPEESLQRGKIHRNTYGQT